MRETEHQILQIGSIAFIVGLVIILVSTFFHASTHDLTDNVLTFSTYAASETWIAVHIGQFAGVMLIFGGGFVTLSRFLTQSSSGTPTTLAILGLALTIIAASTFSVLQAVDGIALKRAVDSWALTPDGSDKKPIYFAVAESIRWIEIGINSLFRILEGSVLLLFGMAIVLSKVFRKWIGVFGIITGTSTIITGLGVAYFGFVEIPGIGMFATVTSFIWPIILGVFMWHKSKVV